MTRLQRLQEWWSTYELLDHPGVVTLMVTLAAVLGTSLLMYVAGTIADAHPPRAAEGIEYCQQECSTATLRLDSIELRNVGTGRGYVCHCSVREESVTPWKPYKGQWCCGYDGGM